MTPLISIVVPSHNKGMVARARITEIASFACDGIEVLVRDNSGDADKTLFLKSLEASPRCLFLSVPECTHPVNLLESVRAASGEFVCFASDDDLLFERGLKKTLALLQEQNSEDVSGAVGTYIVEQPTGSSFCRYAPLNTGDVAKRVGGYLGMQGPNLLFYSTVRRTVALRTFELMFDRYPHRLSFTDQLASLLYLLSGRFLDVDRLTFAYDNLFWSDIKTAADRDLLYYDMSGIDPAMSRLHWLMCGVEGALLIQSRYAGVAADKRYECAALWFSIMVRRFMGDTRSTNSPLDARMAVVARKCKDKYPSMNLDKLLDDICDALALSSIEKAEQYKAFWKEQEG